MLILIIPCILFGDAAPVVIAPGGTVMPVQDDSIVLKKEQIFITVYPDRCEFRVEYVFHNTGRARKVIMGFPNSKNIDGEIHRIDDFKAYDKDKELKTFRKYKKGSGDELYVLHELYELYECFEVYFNKGELKNIINIYSQGHSEIYNSDYMTAKYILTTGALWKDKIDTIKVHITSKIPPMDLTKRTAYFIDDEHFDKPELYSRNYEFKLLPEKYKVTGNIYTMEFKNIDPDFDIEMSIPPSMISSITASSELKDAKIKDRYSVYNLIDGDPCTIWSEGKNGSGINEYLNFNLYGTYKIKRIGFINGNAYNKDFFIKNNRVKTIRLDYENNLYIDNNPFKMKGKKGSVIFNLKDSMDMQYIEFKEPAFISRMKITILDVHKGSKWDDTCLSEVQIITEK